jgi:hypothetical protein
MLLLLNASSFEDIHTVVETLACGMKGMSVEYVNLIK